MLAKIYSAAVYGIDAYEIEIEINAGRADRFTSGGFARFAGMPPRHLDGAAFAVIDTNT